MSLLIVIIFVVGCILSFWLGKEQERKNNIEEDKIRKIGEIEEIKETKEIDPELYEFFEKLINRASNTKSDNLANLSVLVAEIRNKFPEFGK
ncbi:MAG: hypothetical protein PHI66_00230 [Candidatus Pacebacteria bacterium]|nr:hypothetical protein [Candidatus Paceibacterota bacterium]